MYTQNTILKSGGKKVMSTKSVWGSLVLLIKDSFVVRTYGAFFLSVSVQQCESGKCYDYTDLFLLVAIQLR